MRQKIIAAAINNELNLRPFWGTLRANKSAIGDHFDAMMATMNSIYAGTRDFLDPRNMKNDVVRHIAELRFTRRYAIQTNDQLAGVLRILIQNDTMESLKWLLNSKDILQDFIDHMTSDIHQFEHHMRSGAEGVQLFQLIDLDQMIRSKGGVSPITQKDLIGSVRYKCLIRELAFRLTAL
jgi:hypothetical protein